MLILIKFLLIACFGVVCYQDFRQRSFYWFLIPAIFLFSTLLATLTMGSIGWVIRMSAINMLLLCILIGGLLLYILVKRGSLKGAIGREVGIGDLLLFIGIIPLFTPVIFIAVLLVSFIGGLLFYLIVLVLGKPKTTIPLAGVLAAISILYVIFPAIFTFMVY